jgi:hypothetical protein
MDKKDSFDLIIKGFGIYLLVLAIIAFPQAISDILMLIFMAAYNPFSGSPEKTTELVSTIKSGCISGGIGAIVRIVIYIIASVSFLRSGALVRKLMGQKNISPEISQDNTD